MKILLDNTKLNEITHNHSIIAIKNSFEAFPNKFLLYYDTRWSCDLFLNFKDNINNENHIREGLSNKLKIPQSDIAIIYISQEINEKFSQSHKEQRVYCHRLYSVEISSFPDNMRKDNFVLDGTTYCWKSIAEMEQNKKIMLVNSDIVQFVKNNCS